MVSRIVEVEVMRLPRGAWPVWTGSNHDLSRLATRWAKDDPQRGPLVAPACC